MDHNISLCSKREAFYAKKALHIGLPWYYLHQKSHQRQIASLTYLNTDFFHKKIQKAMQIDWI